MKYIKNLFIIVNFIFFIDVVEVKADIRGTLSREYKDGYYYVMSGDNYYRSFEIPFYTLDDKIVYCIEPGTKINVWNYVGKYGFDNSPHNDEINSKLELIGHYGYGYFGNNTLNYRIATQALIWEITGNKEVEFFTKQYGYGEVIDVSKEQEEIMKLVNNHYIKPSFDNQNIIDNINEEIILTDTNNVLEGYEIYDDGGNLTRIEGNKLYIKLLTLSNSKIELRRKKYDEEKTVIFVGEDNISQKVGMFRVEEQISSVINLNVIGAKVKIKKVDSETKENIQIGDIKFKIKNLDTNEYICENEACIFETDNNGIVTTKSVVVGNFQIEELENQELNNYLWNNKPLKFTIDKNSKINDNVYEVEFENTRVKGKIEINKIGEKLTLDNNTYNYAEIPLENVIYGLYANEDIYVLDKIKYKKDELVNKLITDKFGYASSDNLELGKYYIKEISSSSGNLVDNTKYSFELKYQDKYTNTVLINLELKNVLPKGKLEFIKTDLDTGYPIKDTLIEIYDSTNNKIIYSDYTDEFGKITIFDFPLGKYYIKEKESATGYEKTDEIINFELTEDNEIVKLGLTNKIIIKVPDTMINEINTTILIGLIFMIVGIGWYLYAKKK